MVKIEDGRVMTTLIAQVATCAIKSRAMTSMTKLKKKRALTTDAEVGAA